MVYFDKKEENKAMKMDIHKNDIAILGAGGHARDLLWLIENINSHRKPKDQWNVIGFFERGIQEIEQMCDYPVFPEEELWTLGKVAVAVGVGVSTARKKAVEKLRERNPLVTFPILISPDAFYSRLAVFGEGTVVFPGTMLMGGSVQIGDFSVIHISSTIGHDSVLGKFCQVNPGCNVSGCCVLGECIQIGTGVRILPKITIEDYAIIGAGAVVTKNLPKRSTAVGIPAKVIKIAEE